MCMIRKLASPLCAVLLLGACSQDAPLDEENAAEKAVMGEVLPASVSDDMIPLETLRSRPPQAKPVPNEQSGAGGSSATAGGPVAQTGEPAAAAPDASESAASASESAAAEP